MCSSALLTDTSVNKLQMAEEEELRPGGMDEVGMCSGAGAVGAVICMDHCAAQVWVLFFGLDPFGHLLPLWLAVAGREWSLLGGDTKALLCHHCTIFIM